MEIKRYISKEYRVISYDIADVIKWNMIQTLNRKWSMISSIEYILFTPITYLRLIEKDYYYDLYDKNNLIKEGIDNFWEANEIAFNYLEKMMYDSKEILSFFNMLDK